MPDEPLPHLFVEGRFLTEKYTYAGQPPVREIRLPVRDRTSHATTVREQLNQAREENERQRGVTTPPGEPAPIILEIRSEPGFDLKLDSVEDRRKGIEVACVRTEGDVQVATVHVPEGALTHFFKRVEEYLTEDTKGTAKTPAHPKNQELIETIAQLRLATLRSFWTDEAVEFPPEHRSIWWEVWLRASGEQSPWDTFRLLAEDKGLQVGTETIRFPDRLVGLVFGTATQLSSSAEMLDLMAELRKAKENPAAFIGLTPKEQAEWVEAFLPRLTPPSGDAPAVCLLDGGVILNPLVRPALEPVDCHRFDPSWPLADTPGPSADTHGTEMAGVALYGERLADHLAGNAPVVLRHRLESVRILPPRPLANDPRLYGYITSQAASLVEITAPTRLRTFCLPVTTDGRDLGKPSSWSGVVDQLCAGIADENPRLFVISAGNTDPAQRHRYPESNDTDPVQDPAQAWNAVTVGAYTDLWEFDQANPQFSGCVAIAPHGDLSPSSTTSLSWNRDWPIKPDVVLEGGNQVMRPGTATVFDPEQMAMLTTAHATAGTLLVDFRDTSAAAAQAARMATILQAEYPNLWPETVRALLIHSAEWTDAMRRAFGARQRDLVNRLRRYGYGVPSLARARHSARNSLTLIVQQTIQPYVEEAGVVKTKDMGLHDLPWPKEQLLALGEKTVTMRVTLSYFIEPKPGRRDGFVKTRHRYQSHGLRFEVRRPEETLDQFRQRVSKAARDEDDEYEPVGDASGWELGPQVRTRGSVHSDWWTGSAAALANSGHIAVYPVSGWWREAKGHHWTKEARYALVVTIRTEEQHIDIYTPVKAMIEVPVPVETEVESE
jgi:hypothetical protein